MKTLLASTLAFALIASTGARWNPRPYQLTLRRDSNTSLCDIVSFRETQLHKSLLPATSGQIIRQHNVVPSAGSLGNVEIIRFLSYNTNNLWLRVQLECSNDDLLFVGPTGNGFETQVAFGDQGVHGILLDVPVPPLEVVSLLQSGPSDNRIDLAFFSDGCAFHLSFCMPHPQSLHNVQIQCVKETSFLTMQCVWSPIYQQIRHSLPSGLY